MKKVGLVLTIFVSCFLFLLYGPIHIFKDYLITSSMTTLSHQYIAKLFYSEKTINKVLDRNRVVESNEITDASLINIDTKKMANIFSSKKEKEILNNHNNLYKVIKIKGNTYNGYLVAIYKPSKVDLAVSKNIGKKGENILSLSKRKKSIISINGGGYYDPNWSSNGGIPHGTVIKNSKIISNYKDSSVGGGFIGFDKKNKLILGKMSNNKALNIYKDAIEFGPFLIINGKMNKIKGNGGWGIAPRTAIGQRKDGIVLFLVINGRIPTSIGASINDVSEIMMEYGAYNAANLDGGSSSALVINNKIVNTPVASGKRGLRPISTFWIVKK
ncbi:MAG: phosphodiester glycosidase family protein [Bacilli bacterium]|nr:phosphodiester glycosidase family protein [Bacilli bacterium]